MNNECDTSQILYLSLHQLYYVKYKPIGRVKRSTTIKGKAQKNIYNIKSPRKELSTFMLIL